MEEITLFTEGKVKQTIYTDNDSDGFLTIVV